MPFAWRNKGVGSGCSALGVSGLPYALMSSRRSGVSVVAAVSHLVRDRFLLFLSAAGFPGKLDRLLAVEH